jgi:GNAT superfamily N-acetyltransferase
MTLTLRQATLEDCAVLVEFNRRLAQETENKTLDDAVLNAGVKAVLSDASRGLYYVVEREGAIVGQMMITTEWSDWRNGWWWWIQSVYVKEEARRQGVFRALYEHVHREAKRRGDVVGLRLYVERDNTRAQQTYHDLGMEPMPYLMFHRWPL